MPRAAVAAYALILIRRSEFPLLEQLTADGDRDSPEVIGGTMARARGLGLPAPDLFDEATMRRIFELLAD